MVGPMRVAARARWPTHYCVGMSVQRRVPKWSDVQEFVHLQRPSLGSKHKVRTAESVTRLREIAKRRTPRSVFDYTDGAAEAELSLTRARQTFRDLVFHPHVLRDVADVDASRSLLGSPSTLPLVLAPTGFTRMMHHEGERAVVRAAAAAGVPYTLSTMGTVSLEDVAAEAPEAQRWFQLYLWQDRAASLDLIQRADASGYTTLMVTADTAVAGRRLRDVRNGLTIPPALTPSTLADMALHPNWWANLLTTEPLTFASLTDSGGTVAQLIDRMFDPRITLDDLGWLRENFSGRILVKGIQRGDDARAVIDAGADGVVVSNHGGRQLDRAQVPLLALPEVVEAVEGRGTVLLDTGVMDGSDVVAAVALGADAVMIGRAYLYGLMAGGEDGVARVLELFADGITRTMRLLGVTSLDQLSPEYVSLPGLAEPRLPAPTPPVF